MILGLGMLRAFLKYLVRLAVFGDCGQGPGYTFCPDMTIAHLSNAIMSESNKWCSFDFMSFNHHCLLLRQANPQADLAVNYSFQTLPCERENVKIYPVIALFAGIAMSGPLMAQSASDPVALPQNYQAGIHFSTYKRGGITEELFTSTEAIDAAKAGTPFPEGTVITMEDFRAGALYRILVMEKRAEWESTSLSGGWRFGVYQPDGTANLSEDLKSCESCHASAADRDYVFRHDDMLDD